MRFITAWQAQYWWVWLVTLVAPRIINDVSCVRRINDEIHFAWQAQYLWSCTVTFRCKWRLTGEADQSWHSFCVAGALNLVKLEGDSCCSAHCEWRFTGEADQSWDSFCVAGAVFGDVGVWLFVEGAAFRAILGDSRSATCFIFSYKMRLQDGTSQVSEAAGARRRFHGRIMLGSWSNRLYIGGSNWGISRPNLKLRVSLKGDYLLRSL